MQLGRTSCLGLDSTFVRKFQKTVMCSAFPFFDCVSSCAFVHSKEGDTNIFSF